MKLVVFSCDKDEDLFFPFYKCMEKYWPNHPEIVYFTETVINPYYNTITRNYPLNEWTKRIRESLLELDDNIVLTMIDDFFLRDFVNENKLNFLVQCVQLDNVASISLELPFSNDNVNCNYSGFLYRPKNCKCRVSLNCGLWNKDKLINVLTRDIESDPWIVEKEQDDKNYEYYICNNVKVLSWYFDGPDQRGALVFGKWHRDMVYYFNNEKINMDFSIRGFIGD